MAYYTLAIRENGFYAPQFGDYDRETVEAEMTDMIYSDKIQRGRDAITRRDCKIIRTSTAHQSAINAAIAKLNPVPVCIGCDNAPVPGYRVCAACGEEGLR